MERTAEVERLTEHGCSVLCLGCPERMLFGIDYSAWTVGPRFMGVKLIPPGLHYVYCSPSAEDVGVARTGFFLSMKPRDVEVFRWDFDSEELVRLADADEEARYADGVRHFDFDSSLGPYPSELSNQWSELTRHATERLVSKIEPVSKIVRSKRAEYDVRQGIDQEEDPAPKSFDELDDGSGAQANNKQLNQKPMEEDSAQNKVATGGVESNDNCGGGLFFSTVPRPRKILGATPEDTTRLHMDQSGQLETLIAKEYEGDALAILGELQIAYVSFLLGQNCDGFDQWRSLLLLLCSCEAAVGTRPELFTELLRVFFAQLSQAPSDLFEDHLTSGNFMGGCAVSLLEICDVPSSPPRLRKRCAKLRELVEQKFGISTDDLAMLGEDAPQVVDLEGRDLVDLSGPNLTGMD
eukprot:TRINITY_DN38373_c0_g1_i1.p1 TRINITY_DN38373_c0_g1~~TRINITY_DN38373_c0_g1_i1.p1  ORF type:complete len:409 (-),score=86.53 TRINITY_DN38373_c0_g1_i1:87-1313(-)